MFHYLPKRFPRRNNTLATANSTTAISSKPASAGAMAASVSPRARVVKASRPTALGVRCATLCSQAGKVRSGMKADLLLVGREAELPQFLRAIQPATRARINYAGFQPPERLPEYFAQADIFVMPSRYDGWGVVVNQALGAGLPVICSNAVGAGLDLVEDRVNGLRFASGNLDEFERCMKHTVSNPNITWGWGEISRQKAVTLTPEVGAEKWVRVFQNLRSDE